jgi:hypothetical protein
VGKEHAVPFYRLYYYGDDGHIVRRVEFECLGDEEAVAKIAEYADGHALELWREATMLRRLEGGSAPST